MTMTKRLSAILLGLLLAAPVSASAAEDQTAQELAPKISLSASGDGATADDNLLFAGGGTNLTNGIFFPGTTFCDAAGCETYGPPLQIVKGDDITFVNLDPAVVTNGHRIVSEKRKKNKKPLFQSDQVDGPASVLLKTRHLKPGVYLYRCTTHAGMFGSIEVLGS